MSQNLSELNNQAIKAALNQDWDQALALNLHILQLNSQHIPALNRLAKAYEKTGQIEDAKQTYQKVLELDEYNNIAQSNLDRLQSNSASPSSTSSGPSDSSSFSFLEEPGKTKTVWLTKVVAKLIPQLENSQILILQPNKRRVAALTQDEQHIGYLPDDLSAYLIRLIRLGSKFEAAIKKIKDSNIQVFIRETRKSKRLKGLPTFTKDDKHHYPILSDESLDESPLEIPDPEDPEQRRQVKK